MKILELRIPPVALVAVFSFFAWVLAQLTPVATVVRLDWRFALVPAVVGGFFALAGVAAFRSARTTVNPHTPDASSSVVVTGVYRWSRNPMYLGFLLGMASWVLYLGNLCAALVIGAFVAYMNRFQIAPEERILTKKFGQEYVKYASKVRRWI